MADTQKDLITEIQNSKGGVEAQALSRFRSSDSYQGVLTEKMRELHAYYAPNFGDQWPEDKACA